MARENKKFQLNQLEETRNEAHENARFYKKKTKVFHDKEILRKSFISSQKVLLYNSRLHLFPEKLRSRWTRLFVVHVVFPHGAMEVEDLKNGIVFKVNGQHLKPFLKMSVSDNEVMSLHEPQYAG